MEQRKQLLDLRGEVMLRRMRATDGLAKLAQIDGGLDQQQTIQMTRLSVLCGVYQSFEDQLGSILYPPATSTTGDSNVETVAN